MLQQQVDDVGVSLLRRLVEGSVAALQGTNRSTVNSLAAALMLTLTGYLGLGVDLGLSLQQEVDHLDVAIVTGHVQGGVAQLRMKQQQMNHRSTTF